MSKRSLAACWYLTLIGLMLAAAGGLFSWLMWRSFERAEKIDRWPRTECLILESEAEERQIDPARGTERRFKVLYTYRWEGVDFESERYRLRGSSWTSGEEAVRVLEEKYPVGATAECLVNPADPSFAVLEGESKAPGYSIWFPLIFLVGGLGMVVGAWRRPGVSR